MCKASMYAKRQRDAIAGETLGLSMSPMGLGAFHEVGKQPTDCVVCVRNGAELTMMGISQKACEFYGLSGREEVFFVEQPGSHTHVIHDLVVFKAHTDLGAVPLAHLAGPSVRVIAHTVAGADHVVEEIKRAAFAEMPVHGTPTLDEIVRQASYATAS